MSDYRSGRRYLIDESPNEVTWDELAADNDPETMAQIEQIDIGNEVVVGMSDRVMRIADAWEAGFKARWAERFSGTCGHLWIEYSEPRKVYLWSARWLGFEAKGEADTLAGAKLALDTWYLGLLSTMVTLPVVP